MVDLAAQRTRLGDRLDGAIARVLDHGRFVNGPEVGDLERALEDLCGARHAIGCGSGTDALVMVLMAVGIGPGDAVFVPAFTFAATASAVVLCGATPVFVDVFEDTFDLDADSLEAAVSAVRGEGTLEPRAVIPVDLFGQPADYASINDIAERWGLFVLADAAQSLGAEGKLGRVGTMGGATATSFFPSKPLACYGEGGAVFTEDDELADLLRSIRSHGEGAARYEHARLGLNARLDTVQAAVLLEKLRIFPDELAARDRIAARYGDALRGHVRVPSVRTGSTSAWAQYTIIVRDRDAMMERLADAGVASAVHYPKPLNRQPVFAVYQTGPGGVPVSEALASSVLSLPMHPYLDERAQDRVISAVLDASG